MAKTSVLTGALVAACCACTTANSQALTVQTFNKTFSFTSGGASLDFEHLDSAAPTAVDSLQPIADAITPGVLPFTFNDNFLFRGVPAGNFTYTTQIANTHGIALGYVQLEWFSAGVLQSRAFTVSSAYDSASINTTINLDAGCLPSYCVRVQVFGWDDGTATANYGGHVALQAVPEPAQAALWLAGLGVLGWAVRRRGAVGH